MFRLKYGGAFIRIFTSYAVSFFRCEIWEVYFKFVSSINPRKATLIRSFDGVIIDRYSWNNHDLLLSGVVGVKTVLLGLISITMKRMNYTAQISI